MGKFAALAVKNGTVYEYLYIKEDWYWIPKEQIAEWDRQDEEARERYEDEEDDEGSDDL